MSYVIPYVNDGGIYNLNVIFAVVANSKFFFFCIHVEDTVHRI